MVDFETTGAWHVSSLFLLARFSFRMITYYAKVKKLVTSNDLNPTTVTNKKMMYIYRFLKNHDLFFAVWSRFLLPEIPRGVMTRCWSKFSLVECGELENKFTLNLIAILRSKTQQKNISKWKDVLKLEGYCCTVRET